MRIFFDVDGVLINGWHAKPERRRPWDATLTKDLGVDANLLRELLFGQRQRAPYHTCAIGAADLRQVLPPLLHQAGYRGSVDAFLRYWFEHDAVLNADVLAAVEQIGRHSHVELYLATALEHHRARFLWDEVGLHRHFRDIWYTARVGEAKDTPAFFAGINARLGIPPGERPIFFDDTEEVVAAALAAGWDAHVFDSVRDLHRHPIVGALL